MRFVISLLGLVTALTAAVPFSMGLFAATGLDPINPVVPWGQALWADASAMVVLGVAGAILVWLHPRAAEITLWLAAAASLGGMGIAAGMGSAGASPAPLQTQLLSILVCGAVPAVAALSAALLTRRLATPQNAAGPARYTKRKSIKRR
jgi:hypothetical protein